ncbi:Fe-S cluster assembly protein SufD [Nitrospirillum sp. BR 11828]|uniref:Fe-S cluster assembly protein SufD n=1 Tax=Nitrospirillum sp. BR 11828 TaxID=3104325 RepID=UPI002ACA3A23|nr:Fe-S cluster assembly protein SufD [Nitrospirillum sp. BR 11828]MDZ5646188.1 Fe-S cluster assembly protein SufD [Nitrospirillum sp. BR 11828]
MAAIATLKDLYETLSPGLPGAGAAGLDRLRADGYARFLADGIPTPKVEGWKYTNLRDLAGVSLAPAQGTIDSAANTDLDLPSVAPGETHRLVFVDGVFNAALSAVGTLPAGVTLDSLRGLIESSPATAAEVLERFPAPKADTGLRVGPNPGRGQALGLVGLNGAFLAEGAVLTVGEGVTLAQPVEIVFIATAADGAWHPRLLIDVAAGATVTVAEHHVARGGGATFANIVSGVRVGEGAVLRHAKFQEEDDAALHLASVTATVAASGTYETFVLTTGGRLARTDVQVRLEGSGASTRVSGAYGVDGSRHADFTSLIDHVAANCTSREVVKGVIDGKGRAVFQGKIIVRPDAQKTDGHQLNRALLLSDTAEIDAKPELEIYADDVKCSHGATAGELDEEALFYLRARGIPADTARALLIAAFLDEVAEEIGDDRLRGYAIARIQDRIGRLTGITVDATDLAVEE